ncbi:retrovirus-related pol polyprotein from transposon TNT 1-94 [Tanacetum coccineum]
MAIPPQPRPTYQNVTNPNVNNLNITNPNVINTVNDPLYIASSDHPGMVLTNTPFNDVHRWIRCDYMVTCWILNSMVTELSEAFLYAQSAHELWQEIGERYGQCNGPLIYQLERELSQNLNGFPTCNCGKIRECTCGVIEKFIERDSNSKLIQFLMKLSDGYESLRSQILAMDPLPSGNYSKRDVKTGRNDSRHEVKRLCTHCNQEGHIVDQCFEEIGYPDWYKVKMKLDLDKMVGYQKLVTAVCQEMMKIFKGKDIMEDKNYTGTSHAGASDHMSPNLNLFISTKTLKQPIIVHLPDGSFKTVTIVGEDPSTKEIVAVGKGLRCLYICKRTTDQVTFSNSVFEFSNSHKQFSPTVCFNKNAYNNSVYKQSVDVHIFHARLGHTSVSKLIHIPVCNSMDLSKFSCECCMLSKSHRLPFQLSNSMSERAFELLHMDLWGPYKQPALNGAHYFFTIVDDPEPHGLIWSNNGTEIVNSECAALFQQKGILHQRSMAYTP